MNYYLFNKMNNMNMNNKMAMNNYMNMMNNMNNNMAMNNNMNMINNMNMMNNNMVMNNMEKIHTIIKEFNHTLYLNNEQFIIIVKESDSNIIIIECKPSDEFTSLYDYSIELSLKNFYNMGKSFRLCDNIDEIFNFIKNIMSEINLSQINTNNQQIPNLGFFNLQGAPLANINSMKSTVNLESKNNDSFILHFQIPLFNGKYEDIRIEFLKKEKNLYMQYEKLKKKYFKIKSIALGNNNKMTNGNNMKNFFLDFDGNKDSEKLNEIINVINNNNFSF